MEFKKELKKIDFIYDCNAYIKSRILKRNARKIEREYRFKTSKLNYSEELVKDIFNKNLKDRNITINKEELGIVWIGSNKEQDYSGFIQGLRRYGKVFEYMDEKGVYLLEKQNEKFNQEIIRRNDDRLLKFINDIFEKGEKIEILIGQFWGNCFSVDVLKKIQQMKIITINVSMDDRLPNLWEKSDGIYPGVLGLVQGLDLVLTTSPECCIRYLYHDCPVLYWPLGSDPHIFKPSQKKDIDVCFIGNCYGIRKKIVNGLREKGIFVTTYGKGWDNGPIGPNESAEVFGRSKIILGIGTIAYNEDMYTLKLRDFDATMAGGLYITHRNPDLTNLFKEGYEAEYYLTVEEAAKKIKYYLNNPSETEKIGINAYNKAREKYTWENRLKVVFDFIRR